MFDIFEEMERMHRDMERMFATFSDRQPMRPQLTGPKGSGKGKALTKVRSPLCDIKETKNSVLATFEIPGADKKDIDLNVTETSIEVSAKKKVDKEVKDEKKGYYSYMSSASQFYRALPLPQKVLPDKTVATYKDGVLKVTMPKAEVKPEKKGHKINIK